MPPRDPCPRPERPVAIVDALDLTHRAAERVARKLRTYHCSVELLLGACSDAGLAANVTAMLAELSLDVKPCRDVESERRFAEG